MLFQLATVVEQRQRRQARYQFKNGIEIVRLPCRTANRRRSIQGGTGDHGYLPMGIKRLANL
jgi:hypothetical protein